MDYGVSNSKGKTTLSEINRIVTLALKNDIDYFDTAPAYGNSEKLLGKYCKHGCNIITKTPKFDYFNADAIKIAEIIFNLSLNNLSCTKLHGLLIHSADDLFKKNGHLLFDWMREKKKTGLVEKIGISVYSAQQIDKIINSYSIDLIQLPLNIIDQRLINSGHLTKLKELGIEIHARSTFLQGLLIMKPDTVPSYFTPYIGLLKQLHQEAKIRELSVLQLCLGYVISNPHIDKVIVGVNDVTQLEELIYASSIKVNVNEFTFLNSSDEMLVNPSLWKA